MRMEPRTQPSCVAGGDDDMDTLARPLIGLYGLSNGILSTSLQDLSERDAKVRADRKSVV